MKEKKHRCMSTEFKIALLCLGLVVGYLIVESHLHTRGYGHSRKTKVIHNLKAFGPSIALYRMRDPEDRLPMGATSRAADVLGVLAIGQNLPEFLFYDSSSAAPRPRINVAKQSIEDCQYGISKAFFAGKTSTTVPVIASDPAFYDGEGVVIFQSDNSVKYYTSDTDVYIKAFGNAKSLDESKGVITR